MNIIGLLFPAQRKPWIRKLSQLSGVLYRPNIYSALSVGKWDDNREYWPPILRVEVRKRNYLILHINRADLSDSYFSSWSPCSYCLRHTRFQLHGSSIERQRLQLIIQLRILFTIARMTTVASSCPLIGLLNCYINAEFGRKSKRF